MDNRNNIDNLICTTVQTIDKIKEFKNGGQALILYFDYIKHSRVQKTNQVWCNDSFMIKSSGFSKDVFRKAKNLLKKLGLIEVIQTRGEDGKLGKYFIKINFLITSKNREEINKNIITEDTKNLTPEKPYSGKTATNALSNKIKMLKEEEIKMLTLENEKLKKELNKLEEKKEKEKKEIINYKEELNKLLTYWNRKYNMKNRYTDDLVNIFKKVRSKYKKEEIELAVQNYNEFISKEKRYKHRFRLYKFLKQDNGLVQYLNM